MAIEGRVVASCIDENLALDFVQGRLANGIVRAVDEHADGCAACRVLLDEAVRSFRDRATVDLPPGRAVLTVFTRGDVLAGRYRVTRFIARGGMGEVYEAEDLLLGTRLAVKTMNAAISDDPGAIRRLKQEVNLARRITHVNVCRIFDIGIHEPSNPRPGERVLFLTMELIEGVSLGERLRVGGALPEAEARPIVLAMVAALGAAHRAGVVHRDFKSDNVMLSTVEPGSAPRVVVMDFGLASDTSTRTGACSQEEGLSGTLAYMAPEQLDGRPTGQATDIYALGIVMFEMLTGQLPFQGEPPLGGALKRLVENAPALRALVPGIDPIWEVLVARCLDRVPERRLTSVDEVARAVGEQPLAPMPAADTRRSPRRTTGTTTATTATTTARAPWAAVAGTVALAATVALAFSLRAPRVPKEAKGFNPPRLLAQRRADQRALAAKAFLSAGLRAAPETGATQEAAPPQPAQPAQPKQPTTAGRDQRPAGDHQPRGRSARDRRAVARSAHDDRSPRRRVSPDDAGGQTTLPPFSEEPTGGAVTPPRSQDPEDGFIFPRSSVSPASP